MGYGESGVESNKLRGVPKGCLAITVGGTGEEPERLVVPVSYLNHPRFVELLKEVEEEYGFDHHQGTITIPCPAQDFLSLRTMIHDEHSSSSLNHHHHRHLRHLVGCFGV